MDRYTCKNLAVNFQYWCAPCNTFFHAGQRQADFPNGIEVRCWLGHRSFGLSRTLNIHSNQNAETNCLGPSMTDGSRQVAQHLRIGNPATVRQTWLETTPAIREQGFQRGFAEMLRPDLESG